MAGSDRLPRTRSELSGEAQDILAKDLIESRIILTLYFTIFFNQLDNLFLTLQTEQSGALRVD